MTRRSETVSLRRALQSLNLELNSGDHLAIMGSNGAGKTTLLRILAQLILPSAGSVEFTDCSRADVGFVPGDLTGLYARLTGRENLLFFAALYGWHGKAAHQRIDALIDLLAIEAPDQHFQEYSSGMKQRLTLARALLPEPTLLLLDEPTRSLDPAQTKKLHTLLSEWTRSAPERTLILATHSAAEAEALAKKLLVLRHGTVALYDSIAEIEKRGPLQTLAEDLCAQT